MGQGGGERQRFAGRGVFHDQLGRPPLMANWDACDWIAEVLENSTLFPPEGPKPIITGRHLIDIFGMEEGKEIGRVKRLASEAQLDDKFTTLEAGIEWVKALRESPATN